MPPEPTSNEMLGKRLRSLKIRATANRGKSPSPKLSKILSRRYKQKLACRSSSCLPVAKIKCKHWTKTPTRPNAFTTNRMQSWPLPTLKCKRERDCLVPKIAGLVPQVLIPAPLFCELVAHRPSLPGHSIKRVVVFFAPPERGTGPGHCIRCAVPSPSSHNLSFLPQLTI